MLATGIGSPSGGVSPLAGGSHFAGFARTPAPRLILWHDNRGKILWKDNPLEPSEDKRSGRLRSKAASIARVPTSVLGYAAKLFVVAPFVSSVTSTDGLVSRRRVTAQQLRVRESANVTLLPTLASWTRAKGVPSILEKKGPAKDDVIVGPVTRLSRKLPWTSSGSGDGGSGSWSPSKRQVTARHNMIRRLVWLDTEGTIQRIARTQPWRSGELLQENLRHLGRRSPLLQWHMEHNVVPSHAGLGILVAPYRAPPRAAGPSALATESAHRKCMELKRALYEIVPAFFALVREASRRDPKVAWRIYGRLARAGTAFGSWNAGRWLRFAPERQYMAMNNFLRQLVSIVAQCQRILECTAEDDECMLDAVREFRE